MLGNYFYAIFEWLMFRFWAVFQATIFFYNLPIFCLSRITTQKSPLPPSTLAHPRLATVRRPTWLSIESRGHNPDFTSQSETTWEKSGFVLALLLSRIRLMFCLNLSVADVKLSNLSQTCNTI